MSEWCSFRRRSSIGTDRRVRAASKTGHARPRQLPRRRLEMARLDARHRVNDDRAVAVEFFCGEQRLAIFLEAGGAPDAEDVLPHPAPDPVFRVPEGKEPWLETKRLPFFVHPVLAREVVERQLDVVQLRAEICL